MNTTHPTAQPASFFQRLMVLVYDGLLVAAIAIIVSGLHLLLVSLWVGGDTLRTELDNPTTANTYRPLLVPMLFFALYGFFGFCWTRSGSTLGMQAWRLRVVSLEGGAINWQQALMRFIFAWISLVCFGAGYLWALIDREKRTWHDIISGSRMVRTPKSSKPKSS